MSAYNKTIDQTGKTLEQENELKFYINGPLQLKSEVSVLTRERHFDGRYFDETQYLIWAEFRPTAGVVICGNMELGDSIDFANTQRGKVTYISPYVDLQLGKHFNVEFRYKTHSLDVDEGELFQACSPTAG